MRRSFVLSGLVGFLSLAGVGALWADTPPDPLRLVPAQADLVVQTSKPRRLIDTLTQFDWFQQLQGLAPVRELYDSTNARRFYQLVAYFEKELGTSWPEALDRVGGGGMTLAVKFGPDPAPALFILQGTDEELLRKLVKVGLHLFEQELARQEAKDKLERGSYRDLETLRVGKNFFAALAGSALILSNKQEALHRSLDLHLDGADKSLVSSASVAEARRLLPKDPLGWLWVNLEPLHQLPQAKEVFALPRNDVNLTVLFGGMIDVVRRAPFVCAAVTREKTGFLTTVRMPRGRDGMPAELSAHVPLDDSTLPALLEPRGVLYSSSFHFDLAKFWENRTKLFNDKQVKAFEEFDKTSGKFLLGTRFSKLVSQVGPHQRFVAAHQPQVGYKVQPQQRLPAFALIASLRDPAFGKAMEAILRGAAFLAGTQVSLKLVEEKHGELTIVGYRFPEDGTFRGDTTNVRFNFSPCFVTVGDQFVACSTVELCRELLDLLRQESLAGAPPGEGSRATGLSTARSQLELRETLLDKTIAQLAEAKDKKERGKLIAQLQQLEYERQAYAAVVAALEKVQVPNRKGRAGVPVTSRTQLYASGGVAALRLTEDQLLVQTILNQALAPSEAKKQVEAFIELVRRLGVLQIDMNYGVKDFRFDVRLNMAK